MAVLPIGIGSAAGGGGFNVERSLRFNSADSAYLNRTFASAGNRATWTWSAWVKRSFLDSTATSAAFQTLFHAGVYTTVAFSADSIYFQMANGAGGAWYVQTSQVFRDPSAWYHIVAVLNTPAATASQRMRLYINGVEVTAFSTDQRSSITQSTTSGEINNNISHAIGSNTTPARYFSGYQTETYFIDGQALTPSSFGETDSATGVWKPKAYTGTYGTNGFYLKFADNSGTTSTTLGKDSSGNGNNWTPNNFSVTAGAGNDSLVDSPTSYGTDTGVGGEVRGNYATLNPLKIYGANFTYSNGNLQVTDSSSSYVASIPTLPPPNSGKWYWEVTVLAQTTSSTIILGLATEANAYSTSAGTMASYGRYRSDGDISNLAGTTQTAGSSYTTNDVIGVALDVDSGTVRFYKNGVAQGATPSFSFTAGTVLVPYVVGDNTAGTKTLALNFGQRPFAYTAPSGFKALCTQNLPTPTIGATSTTQANRYFDIKTRTGTGSTYSVTGVPFAPEFIWTKARSSAYDHNLADIVRGTTKALRTNLTAVEMVADSWGYLSAFNSDGYTAIPGSANFNNYGANTVTYVDWMWKANGAGSSNTAGTITSTVSANTTSGFSIVTYTGTGANATVGHGLGVAPSMIIIKARGSVASGNWTIYNKDIGATKYLYLNSTIAASTFNHFQNTDPTSSLFYVVNDGNVNQSSIGYVAYCFAPVAGYSAFGSYTGNGSTDGPFVYTGFRPRYIMQKRTDSTGTWELYDTARDTYNVMSADLAANLSDAETSVARFDSLSNGFKIRTTGAATNASGGTYIYACFAETPAKFSLAR